MTLTAGYDVGGAHLKVALVENGKPIAVQQIACPLWRGLDELDAALAKALALTGRAKTHAVTMTGELADVFPDRYTGVVSLVEHITAKLGPRTQFWMGKRGMGSVVGALAHTGDVASTNFLATATIIAKLSADGLFIDMGSTTTDMVAFAGGAPLPRGLTDAERLTTGELVYTGLTRTPVMAVTQRGVFRGHWQTMARDPFATMADVRRVMGTLPEGVDQHRTADGRSTSVAESRARLARCFGRDVEASSQRDWEISARAIHEAQVASVLDGALQVMSAEAAIADPRVVVAGIGAELAANIADRLGYPHITFGELVGAQDDCRTWATRCAPAVAVAMLATQSA
jgi:(4-(4-[2-(gamma-L-glutamylamino)ethyl]phenoxymethyl)furan-2-yl)methanamine synthase